MIQIMLVQKKKPETDKELGHIDLYWSSAYIGYIIRNESKFVQVGENWNFVSKHLSLPHTFERTRVRLLEKITKMCLENGI
jgi:hypothetical protein